MALLLCWFGRRRYCCVTGLIAFVLRRTGRHAILIPNWIEFSGQDAD
jgi:hypothetical protein